MLGYFRKQMLTILYRLPVTKMPPDLKKSNYCADSLHVETKADSLSYVVGLFVMFLVGCLLLQILEWN